MPIATASPLQPRKSPVQARSNASVDALLEATLQVLVAVGKERLTTTRVAERAGVSVGTLYQYFPNKSSLLQATLRRHFEAVTAAVLQACENGRGKPLVEMGQDLASAFLRAKLRDGKTSVALYAVSSDVDGLEIARQITETTHAALQAMLESAPDAPDGKASMVASVLQATMSGVSRRLLESEDPPGEAAAYEAELLALVAGYLQRVAGQHRASRAATP